MELAKKVDKVFVPVRLDGILPDWIDDIYTLTQEGRNEGLVKELNNKYILSEEELRAEIKRAYMYGQRNAEMMEAGLERDEVEDYVNYRML